MHHGEIDIEDRTARERDRLLEIENGFARLVAQAGTGIDAPRGVVVGIDGVLHRPEQSLLTALIGEFAAERRLRHTEVRGGFYQFDLLNLCGIAFRRGFDDEFRQRAKTLGRASGAAGGEIGVGQQFEAHGGDVLHVRFGDELHLVAGGGVAERQHGAVLHGDLALAAGGDVFHFRPQHGPLRLVADLFLPRRHPLHPARIAVLQSRLGFQRAAVDVGALHLFGGRIDRNIGFVRIVEEGENLVVFFLLDGIELVVVALGTLNGDAQNAFADRFHPVEHGLHAELFGIDAAFFVDHRIAQKAGRDDLILCGVGFHIAGNLVDNKLVVGQIVIEGVDHPVAIEPHRARGVLFITVGIGVARRVEPDARPAFAVVGRREQTIHLFLVGLGAWVGEEGVDFLGSRRKPDEVEAEAAQERDAVGLGGGFQALFVETREDEGVDGSADPIGAADLRERSGAREL